MSWSDWLTGSNAQSYDEAQAHIEEQKKILADKVAAREAAGTLTQEQAANMYNTALSQTASDQNEAAAQGFMEGLKEGWQNVLEAPGKGLGAVFSAMGTLLGTILKNIPIWAYLVGGVVLFFYFGGGMLIRGWVAKKARA